MYCKITKNIKNEYTDLGCSPEFATDLINWLNSVESNAEELHIALYLFNNPALWNAIETMAQKGCKVFIYSIPLEGYDNDKPISIYSEKTKENLGQKTKLSFAEQIYQEAKKNRNPNLHFNIFPHLYLRSPRLKKFSRGLFPYSLHCKTLLLRLRNGESFIGITSSNLAVRDAQKIELGFVSKLNTAGLTSATNFFEGLKANSIPILDFDENKDYSHFEIKKSPNTEKSNLMFIAPFFYDSANIFEENVETIISKATERIIICAQHVCSYKYKYYNYDIKNEETRPGFLTKVLEKASKVPTKIISQTYVDENGQTYGCRKPENKYQFMNFIKEARLSGCKYYTNPNIHAKYIVVDNSVLITTCNFTPTSFIYIDKVIIPSFDNNANYSYSGTFCEVGAYFAIINKDLADSLARETDDIISLESTKQMF